MPTIHGRRITCLENRSGALSKPSIKLKGSWNLQLKHFHRDSHVERIRPCQVKGRIKKMG